MGYVLNFLIGLKGDYVVFRESGGPERTNTENHVYWHGGLNDWVFESPLIYDQKVRAPCACMFMIILRFVWLHALGPDQGVRSRAYTARGYYYEGYSIQPRLMFYLHASLVPYPGMV